MAESTFFLRFYGQTDAGVEECVAKLKSANPKIIGHRFGDTNLSVNFAMRPSHTVHLIFAPGDEDSMVGNDACRIIYMEYATPDGKGAFNQRMPGQSVFSH